MRRIQQYMSLYLGKDLEKGRGDRPILSISSLRGLRKGCNETPRDREVE
jgi:hypothetical protein